MIDFTDLEKTNHSYSDVDMQILTEVKNIVNEIIPIKRSWVDTHAGKWALVFVFERELTGEDIEFVNSSVPSNNLLDKEFLFTTKENFKSAYFELLN